MKRARVGLKMITEWIALLIFTVSCILISFHLLRSFFTFHLGTFFPMTPASVGESSVYPLVIDETISQKLFIANEFQTPTLETTSDSLARYLFQDFNLPVEVSSDHQQEKQNLIETLFPFQTLDSVAPYVEVIQQLPKELLELMVRDELYFITMKE